MLAAPDDLADQDLIRALADRWGLRVATLVYRPVGFGSHHWEIADPGGTRWFGTVDELAVKRLSEPEPLDAAFARLRAALGAAGALREHGHPFVVAPVPTADGEPLVRLTERYGLALYPFVDGRSYAWGEFAGPAHRRAVLDLLLAVHAAPPAVCRHAQADDFAIPHRDELAAALHPVDDGADLGPYARPAAQLIATHAAPIRRRLERYDQLVRSVRAQPDGAVLTHGEPHPGNTMLAADGWRLIDWDTALLAPPERDLWALDPGDGSILDAYAAATRRPPRPSVLELYRIRWDLADIAVDVSRFRRPHTGNSDDDESWAILRSLVSRIGT